MNIFLTIIQIIVAFTGVALIYRLFGKIGAFVAAAILTLFANIEVASLVEYLNLPWLVVSLGNVAFVGVNMCQDLLNENEGGEKVARHTVWMSFATSILVVLLSQISLHYIPTADSVAVHDAFATVMGYFGTVTIISLCTFLISNTLNVKLYAFFSKYTKKIWVRSQASTWISQFADTVIMTVACAVFGIFPWSDVLGLILTTYIIKGLCMVMEIPFLYWVKDMKVKGRVRDVLITSAK